MVLQGSLNGPLLAVVNGSLPWLSLLRLAVQFDEHKLRVLLRVQAGQAEEVHGEGGGEDGPGHYDQPLQHGLLR